MATFVMLGKYSSESLREASKDRTSRSISLIEEKGGRLKAMYALLGGWDLCMVTEFGNVDDALAASVELNKSTGIAFNTLPAVAVAEFDNLL
jgi:uncharacterized protein with GYD domain